MGRSLYSPKCAPKAIWRWSRAVSVSTLSSLVDGAHFTWTCKSASRTLGGLQISLERDGLPLSEWPVYVHLPKTSFHLNGSMSAPGC